MPVHGTRTSIVCGQRSSDLIGVVLILDQQFAQQPCTGFHVLRRVVRISAESAAAVAGINCITPIAPFGESALAWNADSTLATECTKSGGRPLLNAASRTSSLVEITGWGFGSGAGATKVAGSWIPPQAWESLPLARKLRFATGEPVSLPSLVNNRTIPSSTSCFSACMRNPVFSTAYSPALATIQKTQMQRISCNIPISLRRPS